MWHGGSWRLSQIITDLGGHLGLTHQWNAWWEFYHHFGGSLCGHPLVQLCWILRSNNFLEKKLVGWLPFWFLQRPLVQDGFLLRKMDATIHSNHPKLPRVPSSMLFFSACSISKNVGTTPQPSEKKNHPPRGHSPHWRRAWEPEGLRFYDYQTPGGVNTPGLQKMAKGKQKLH